MKMTKDILIAFQMLLDNQGCLTVHQLSQFMRISRVQAKQIIEDCVYWLGKRGVRLKDEREKRSVQMLPEGLAQLKTILRSASEEDYYYSFFERRKYIVFKLFSCSFITNYQICELFEISRNTCIADMTAISRFLIDNGFETRIVSNNKGYMLAGNEAEIRRLIPFYISLIPVFSAEKEQIRYHVEEENLFPLYGFEYEKIMERADRLERVSNEMNIKLSLQSAVYISLSVELIVQRIVQGRCLSFGAVEEERAGSYTKNCVEYLILKSGIWQEVKCAVATSGVFKNSVGVKGGEQEKKESLNSEKELLQQTIICMGSIWEDNLEQFVSENNSLEEFAEEIITEFEARIGLGCKKKKVVIEKLGQSLSGVLLREIFGFHIFNPFVEAIQKDYKYIFNLTKELETIKAWTGVKISEKELAYLTAQLIGWVIQDSGSEQRQKIPLIGIVCANNIGIGALVEKQIQNTFHDVRTILVPSYEVSYWAFYNKLDLLVAPMLLKIDENIPCVRVNPVLTLQDKSNIYRKLSDRDSIVLDSAKVMLKDTMNILKDFLSPDQREQVGKRLSQLYGNGSYEIIYKGAKKYMLKDLLTADRIQFTDYVQDWRDAIRLAAAPLIEDGSITQNYVRAMIDSIETTGPYIILTPGVALPHARPSEGAKKLAMSMLYSKERIYFSDEKYANLIIVLSSVDGHSHINALVHLSNMFGEEETLKQFLEAQNAEEVVVLIRQYEAEEREGV